ncbi:hypothetical protein H5410_049952 [Solanum commersonii]|uniref:Uncharacterized protein n=1 Tax=Solanum commersonii TaxID=4109 RepID=A0A9J5WVN5_SOLCO|nr:hypothetical protein H5410_049952 [Solanum commersonii]
MKKKTDVLCIRVEKIEGVIRRIHNGREIRLDEIHLEFWKSTCKVDMKWLNGLFNEYQAVKPHYESLRRGGGDEGKEENENFRKSFKIHNGTRNYRNYSPGKETGGAV